MANTLKFGNGEWYGKKDTILAYNDLNSNYKPLPFNFSRDSKATVINKDGLIEEVGSGQPRIDYKDSSEGALLLEPSRTNLITYSSDFSNSYWTKSGATIQADPSTAGSELVTNGSFTTDSDWTKGTGWSISGGALVATNVTTQAAYQLGAIVVGKTYKATFEITQHTEGSVALRVGTSSQYQYFGGVGVYTTYIYNVGGASQLRFNANGTTNLSIDNVSVKEVQGFTSPDGTNNAYKLVENTSSSSHSFRSSNSGGSVGNKITTSFFVKADTRNWCRILGYDGSSVWFDLSNGIVGTQDNAVGEINLISNGWYKISSTYTSSHATREKAYLYLATADNTSNYQGDGTSGIYVFGGQLELGSYSSSLINTQGSAVTRLRDLSDTQNLSHVIGQTEGVIFYDAILVHKSTSTSEDLFELSIDDGSNQNIFFINNYNNTLTVGMKNGGSNQFYSNSYNPTEGARYKLAFAYKQNDFSLYINGNQIATDSSGTVPAMNQITFGNYYNNQSNLSNSVKVNNLQLYNTRLSNSELAALTQV